MRRLIALAAFVAAAPLHAHAGHRHGPSWTLSPEIVLPLGLVLLAYLAGFLRLRARSQTGAATARPGAPSFLAGWLLLTAALVSPLHDGGERSFALHMVEHEIIMLPAALLLVLGRPGPVLLWSLPHAGRLALAPILRLSIWRELARPVAATAIQAICLIAWHLPPLFNRALRYEGWHIAQHFSFVLSALLFWWAMIGRPGRGQGGVEAMCLFATSMIGGALGALMALSNSPWYPVYARMPTMPFDLSPAEDQQFAGLIMWVPGGLFHAAAALIMLRGLLSGGHTAKVSKTA